jgi:hypothetical protein
MKQSDSFPVAHHAVARLERLSVDSHWAYQASGLRRSLMRCLDEIESNNLEESERARQRLNSLVERAFYILENSAKEIGDRPH